MSKQLYEIRLDPNVVPAVSRKDALDVLYGGGITLQEGDYRMNVLLDEDKTVRLFTLGRMMYRSEKYEYDEISAALLGLCKRMGCEEREAEMCVETVCVWCERLEDEDDETWEEWLMRPLESDEEADD